ncbi:hypothetical protein WB388_17965 [Streptomyces brasiliscabiei]|uniref:Uncharacterized protein n=1 Tax=Streptomyces brasiliscabiei TaxID=2736302 RepID=A0ABU8GHK4_9ACTN
MSSPPTRPVLELRPGDQVHDPSGTWLTVATRPVPNHSGARLTWTYLEGVRGRAHWLAEVPCRPAHATTSGAAP